MQQPIQNISKPNPAKFKKQKKKTYHCKLGLSPGMQHQKDLYFFTVTVKKKILSIQKQEKTDKI